MAELLSFSEFDALHQFLNQAGADVQQLQAMIDQLVDQARRDAESPLPSETAAADPAWQQLIDQLRQAVALGQDIEALLADLRTQFLQAAPDNAENPEETVDALLNQLRSQLADVNLSGEAQPDNPC